MKVFCWLGWNDPTGVSRADRRPRRRGRSEAADAGRARAAGEDAEDGVPAELAEGDDHAHLVEDRDLAGQERGARVALLDRRLVGRRGAPDGGGDPHAGEGQAVVGSAARGPVGHPELVQGPPQEVARRVAGEDAAGPVRTVRRRGQANDQHRGVGVAEAGRRPAPVRLVAEAEDLLAGHLLAPGDEARTAHGTSTISSRRASRAAARAPAAVDVAVIRVT